MPSEPHISNPQVISKKDQEFTTAKGNSTEDKPGDKHDGREINWMNWIEALLDTPQDTLQTIV